MHAASGGEVTLISPSHVAGVNQGFWGARCAVLGIGLLVHWAMCRGFDYLLHPFVIFKMGPIAGGAIMLFLCCAVCYGTFLLYDRSKNDWLGIEALKDIRAHADQEASNRLVSWILRQPTPIALLLLSLKFDPFVTTAFLRSGGAHRYDGFRPRDWSIFICSLLIGNGYWTVASVGLLEYGWGHFVR